MKVKKLVGKVVRVVEVVRVVRVVKVKKTGPIPLTHLVPRKIGAGQAFVMGSITLKSSFNDWQ